MQSNDDGARSAHAAKSKLVSMANRLIRSWRGGGADPGQEHRMDVLEARMEHLEAELEGLQDALYRQAVREGEHVDELRKRTAPDQVARDLSQDARRRGL